MAQDLAVGEVAKQLDQACRETGFFYVKGHGVPESLMKEVRTMTHKIFNLPYEEKLKIKMTPAAGYRGYEKLKENITKGVPDLLEAVDFYKEIKTGTYGKVGDIIAGCLLSLINQDDHITALEVRNLSGEWIPATPIPGTFVCNIGDMLKIWSNGLYEATLHQVINNSPKYRVSVGYFYEGNLDAVVEPLEVCVKKCGGNRVNEKAVYGNHLINKVKNNYVM
ncbi:hypothetical protein REPUB_Repub10bG0140300 [Reevesia pubescens]